MLVDDKPSVLAGLRQLGDWEAMGVELAGEALDGASALRLAEQSPPDILLTDIHMPVMDGLELSHRVLERWPQVKVILLTGYDQFEYAQAALRLGAVEFLTKPSTVDEIRFAVRRAAAMLDKAAKADAEREALRRQVQESLPHLRREYMARLLLGHVSPADLPGILQFASLPLPVERLVVICFGLDLPPDTSDPAQPEIERLAFSRLVGTIFPTDAWALARGRDGNPVIIGCYPAGEEPDETRTRLCALVESALGAAMAHSLPVSAGVSRQAPSLLDLPRAYEEAYTALQQRFFLGVGAVIHVDDLYSPTQVAYPAWAEEQIVLALRSGSDEQLHAGLRSFFAHLSATNDRQQVQMICAELLVVLTRVLRELSVAATVNAPPPDVQRLGTIAEVHQVLGSWLAAAIHAVRWGQQSRQVGAIAQLRAYIQAHVGKDCSLAALAEVVHLNPTYLAQLFKRQTGQTVLEYVTQAKMDRAKLRLVTSDDKVTTICDELGYNDQRHFVDLFRRTTGATPTEYRAQFRPDRSGGRSSCTR